MVVCKVKPHKEDPNCTRITVAGSQIFYPGNVGTPTGLLDLIKLIISSVLSLRNARLFPLILKNVYLQTRMERSKYVRIKFSDIPQEFIEEYDLSEAAQIVGYILKSFAGVMAYHNSADWQMTSCAPVSIRRDFMKPPQHLASGAISGILSNLCYSWTTSALDM